MAITIIRRNTHSVWANSFSGNMTIGAVQEGDLVILMQMINNKKIAPGGYTSSGSTSNGLAIFYKEIEDNGTEVINVSGAGGLYSAILRSTRGRIDVVAAGGQGSPNTTGMFNQYKDVAVISTCGSAGDNPFSSNGWTVLNANAWSGDTYKYFMKYFPSNVTIPSHNIWGVDSYLVLEEMGAKLYMAVSSDGKTFSEYMKISSGDAIQGRFLKFKLFLESDNAVSRTIKHEFDQQDAQSKVALNKFIEGLSTNIKPVITYFDNISELEENEENIRVLSKIINKTEFKKIKKIEVLEQ